MKWLQDNPLGMALTAISGVFALLALGMAIVWNLPLAVETAEIEPDESGSSDTVLAAHQVAAISSFQVINESRCSMRRAPGNSADLKIAEPLVAARDGCS